MPIVSERAVRAECEYDVPQNEEVVLLHAADVRVTGLDPAPMFRAVLRGAYRLTRLQAGAVKRVAIEGKAGHIKETNKIADTDDRRPHRELMLFKNQ